MRAFFLFIAATVSLNAQLILNPKTGEVQTCSESFVSQYHAAVLQEMIQPRLGKLKKSQELEKALQVLEELKNQGLSKEEFEEAKAKALKKLEELRDANSALIDDQELYKQLDTLQIACVDFDGSQKILTQRQAEIFLHFHLKPYATLASPEEDEDLDDPFLPPVENPIVTNGDIKGFSDLPLHEWEKQIISHIIMSMAEKNVFQLLLEKQDLEKKGKKINPVHPLRFLGYACSDPKLKKGMKAFRKNPFKWDSFIHGLAGRLKEEAGKDNLLRFIPEFSLHVGADPNEVIRHLNQAEYENLVLYLISI